MSFSPSAIHWTDRNSIYSLICPVYFYLFIYLF